MEIQSQKHHWIKTMPEYFRAVEDGVKNFEVRLNDRNYEIGDILHLQEFSNGKLTGKEIAKKICYILDSEDYCKKGYVVIGMCQV